MAALKEVVVPDIGDFQDIPVIEILVAEGDAVEVDTPLVELESDKATMEVPAPFAGVVRELRVAVGDKVSQGSVLMTVEASDGAAAAAAEPEASPPTSEAGAAASISSAVAAEAQAGEEGEPAPPPPAEPPAASQADGAIHASPAVRRLARERGIDLTAIEGSGRKGRIVTEDLDRAPDAAPSPAGDERLPLTRIQKLSAANLARNWSEIPHVTHHEDADITDLEAFRKQLNAEQQDVKVTMVALLLKASSATLRAFPRFNASLDGDDVVLHGRHDLGFAADTPNGLVVPVIRDVERKGLLELAAELTELSGKARAGKLGFGDIGGATFTISSLGGIGGTGFTPIINAPEVAILGAVRSHMRPVWDGAAFVPRLMLPLSLSYDHRVIDGAAAARFCAHLAGLLTDLRRVLL